MLFSNLPMEQHTPKGKNTDLRLCLQSVEKESVESRLVSKLSYLIHAGVCVDDGCQDRNLLRNPPAPVLAT